MTLKKVLYHTGAWLFMAGAGLTLGLFSFTGMMVLAPILPLAYAAFALAVAYEGEIYLQNIKGAFKKLFTRDYLKQEHANEFLLAHFPTEITDATPTFFKDYNIRLQQLAVLDKDNKDKANLKKIREAELALRIMEAQFAALLFDRNKKAQEKTYSPYNIAVITWLESEKTAAAEAAALKLKIRKRTFLAAGIFSLGFATVLMGIGTFFLLTQAFFIVPWFAALPVAAWPMIILPLAVLAGIAYGHLTYNAMTDMIQNETLQKWYRNVKNLFTSKGLRWQDVLKSLVSAVIIGIAIALTVCTAGTWWSIAKNLGPFFLRIGKTATLILALAQSFVIGTASLVFNLQNINNTLESIQTKVKESIEKIKKLPDSIREYCQTSGENKWQLANIPRILIKLLVDPLRVIFFLGHVISIGVGGDQMPGLSEILSTIIGIFSEGIEDHEYFFPKDCESNKPPTCPNQPTDYVALRKTRLDKNSGHHHGVDIPTFLIKVAFSPLYLLAMAWDVLFSQMNAPETRITWKMALKKFNPFRSEHHEHHHDHHGDNEHAADEPKLSLAGEAEQATYKLDQLIQRLDKTAIGQSNAENKKQALIACKGEIEKAVTEKKDTKTICDLLTKAANDDRIKGHRHRLFTPGNKQTHTAQKLNQMAQSIRAS